MEETVWMMKSSGNLFLVKAIFVDLFVCYDDTGKEGVTLFRRELIKVADYIGVL